MAAAYQPAVSSAHRHAHRCVHAVGGGAVVVDGDLEKLTGRAQESYGNRRTSLIPIDALLDSHAAVPDEANVHVAASPLTQTSHDAHQVDPGGVNVVRRGTIEGGITLDVLVHQ